MRSQLKSTARETWIISSRRFTVERNISLLNYVKIISNNRSYTRTHNAPVVGFRIQDKSGRGISGLWILTVMSEGESRCWKGADVKGVMLNTIGDHTKETSIKLCQTKPAFYTESKTHTQKKRDRMRDVGSNKKERWSDWRQLDSARVPQRRKTLRFPSLGVRWCRLSLVVVSAAVITTVITQTAAWCLSKWGFIFVTCAQIYYVRCICTRVTQIGRCRYVA